MPLCPSWKLAGLVGEARTRGHVAAGRSLGVRGRRGAAGRFATGDEDEKSEGNEDSHDYAPGIKEPRTIVGKRPTTSETG